MRFILSFDKYLYHILSLSCMLMHDIKDLVLKKHTPIGHLRRTTYTKTNDNCKLNGYSEKWLYPCACN